jgi:hypothetical protein
MNWKVLTIAFSGTISVIAYAGPHQSTEIQCEISQASRSTNDNETVFQIDGVLMTKEILESLRLAMGTDVMTMQMPLSTLEKDQRMTGETLNLALAYLSLNLIQKYKFQIILDTKWGPQTLENLKAENAKSVQDLIPFFLNKMDCTQIH